MKHFAQKTPSDRRMDEIVKRRRLVFHRVFPHERAERRKRERLPKIKTVRPARRKINRSLIRMPDLVYFEFVLIPHPRMRDIVPHRFKRNICKRRSRDNSIERRYENIERKNFACGDRAVPKIGFGKFRLFEIALDLFADIALIRFCKRGRIFFGKIDRLGFNDIACIFLRVKNRTNAQ